MSKNSDQVYTNFYEPFMGNARKNNPVQNEQALTERMYIRVLTEMAANRFKWVGLPDTIDERFLELNLFWRALTVFYFDSDFGRYLALTAAGSGRVNMYDNPTTFTVTGGAMINKRLTSKECVPIWSNYLRIPDLDIVHTYAKRLAKMDRTIDIEMDAMRHNTIVTAPENQRNSWVNIMRQRDEGQPIIFGTNAMDPNQVQAFNISPHPETLEKLMIARSRLWNDCMGMLGIDNANQDKKERLVAAEVGANDEQVSATKAVNLNARQMAAQQINRMFGLSVEVDYGLGKPAELTWSHKDVPTPEDYQDQGEVAFTAGELED